MHVQRNALLLADVFDNFRNNVMVYIGLILLIFFENLITDINMLLMVEKKRIRGGMCHAIHQYAIAIDRCMKGYD